MSSNSKSFFETLLRGKSSKKIKILATLSVTWMAFIGYMSWWNGISNPGFDKSFKWDEWIWFGFVPATFPFVIYMIWKEGE